MFLLKHRLYLSTIKFIGKFIIQTSIWRKTNKVESTILYAQSTMKFFWNDSALKQKRKKEDLGSVKRRRMLLQWEKSKPGENILDIYTAHLILLKQIEESGVVHWSLPLIRQHCHRPPPQQRKYSTWKKSQEVNITFRWIINRLYHVDRFCIRICQNEWKKFTPFFFFFE